MVREAQQHYVLMRLLTCLYQRLPTLETVVVSHRATSEFVKAILGSGAFVTFEPARCMAIITFQVSCEHSSYITNSLLKLYQ